WGAGLRGGGGCGRVGTMVTAVAPWVVKSGMDGAERDRRARQARDLAPVFATEEGVRLVALTWVDNAGITRVKAVPLDRLEAAAGWGVGMSPVFDGVGGDDAVPDGRCSGVP